MRANFIHIEAKLRQVLASGVAGDVAEFGVWHGTTFLPMAELARVACKRIHAVDSFVGMMKETARDAGRYVAGSLSVGGSDSFRELVKPFRNAVVHEGFIPEILPEMADCRFCFVHLNVDQYQPTLDALRFLWPRMEVGGVIMCHDWFAGNKILAAGAIADWMDEAAVQMGGEQNETQHCWFVK